MDKRVNVLIELGLEELPTRAVLDLAQAGQALWQAKLQEAGLDYDVVEYFATPRRLAWRLRAVSEAQADQQIERRGPALQAAKDAQGNWTKAALGFASSCGVNVEELETLATEKGEWLMFYALQKGQALSEILPSLFAEVMLALPIAKRMRWGEHEQSFVRPVLSVVALMDAQVLPLEFFGVQAGRESLGHRMHHPQPVVIEEAMGYEQALKEAFVLVEPNERRAVIEAQVRDKAKALNAHALLVPELLTEVASLVEYPVAVVGQFEARFLQVPQEVLITTMQDNQKTFALVDDKGKMLPYFVAIANLQSQDEAVVRKGNEKVIRPRFADAEFFWKQDLKRQLEDYLPALEKVVFQEKLGSLADKTRRMVSLSQALLPMLAGRLTLDEAQVMQAVRLSKCDLLSEMVMEFPELQGIMGRYYAQQQGLDNEVALALEQQYYPLQSGGDLPTGETALLLAVVEKVEALVGGFAIGARPTGSKDPYALRRMAIGLIRLLLEKRLPLSLQAMFQASAQTFAPELNAKAQVQAVRDYVLDRLQGYYREQGVSTEVYQAVRAVCEDDLLDFEARVRALQAFLGGENQAQANSLLASAKRIRNLLRKQEAVGATVNEALFVEQAEQALWQQWLNIEPQLSGDYAQVLTALGSLASPLEAFFASVMVNAEDKALRRNRLALLQRLQAGFDRVADLSLLSV